MAQPQILSAAVQPHRVALLVGNFPFATTISSGVVAIALSQLDQSPLPPLESLRLLSAPCPCKVIQIVVNRGLGCAALCLQPSQDEPPHTLSLAAAPMPSLLP